MTPNKKINPPRLAQRFLEWYCRPELLEDLQGDLNEYFQRNCETKGIRRAQLIYILDVMKFLRGYTLRKPSGAGAIQWSLLKNYSLIAFRGFNKRKLDTSLNILSLTIGITSFIIISLYVFNEFSYNTHFPNHERIARISLSITAQDKQEVNLGWANVQLREELLELYPEVNAATGLFKLSSKASVKRNGSIFLEDNIYEADSHYFEVFWHPWVHGDTSALREPGSVVLTETLSRKYFGDENPINKTLTINNRDLNVTGVIKDQPFNSDLRFSALLSLDRKDIFSDWCFTFVLFNNTGSLTGFQQKLDAHEEEYAKPVMDQTGSVGNYHLEPLADIHLGEPKLMDAPKGSKSLLYLFSGIAILILLIACANYITIHLAQLLKKQSEIGIRKTFGARLHQIRTQIVTETFLIVCLSFALSTLLIIWFIPLLRQKEILNFYPEQWIGTYFLFGALAVIIVISLLMGSYVTFSYSRTNAVGHMIAFSNLKSSKFFQFGFIMIHLSFAVALVFSSNIVNQQVDLLLANDADYNREQVMVVDLPTDITAHAMILEFKNSIKQLAFISNVSAVNSNAIPTHDTNWDIYRSSDAEEGSEESWRTVNSMKVDDEYFSLFNIQLKEGRTFQPSEAYPEDVTVVNEAWVKKMSWKSPLEHTISGNEVIGVVEDFNFYGQRLKPEPLIYHLNNYPPEKMMIKFSNATMDNIETVRKTWKSQLKEYPLEYRFLNTYFEEYLKNENMLKKLLNIFTTLALVIASLGLFAAINIKMEQKLKEVSIRKIFGAKLLQLLSRTSLEYIMIIMLASCTAFAMAIIPLQNWLAHFEYKIPIGIMPFMDAILIVSFLMFLAILYQAFRINKLNPLEGTKYE